MQNSMNINIIDCRLCTHESHYVFSHTILQKYTVSYFLCSTCGLLQTERPYWLKEAYASPINNTDTGLLSRNDNLKQLCALLVYFWLDVKGTYLDYAGGYGVFTRMMRDIGFDFYWTDPYTKNIFAIGFDYAKQQTIDGITAFEVLEHLEEPITEIEQMLEISDVIFCSTFLFDESHIPDPAWHYYGFDHGQHIALYSKKTLEYIAKRYHLYLYSNNKNLHILSRKKLPYFSFKLLYMLRRWGAMRYITRKLTSKTSGDSVLLSTQTYE